MDQVEIAWLAGLYEGGGSLAFTGKLSCNLTIKMTDRDVIERCQEITGAGALHGPYNAGRAKPLWEWHVRKGVEVARILLAIYPLLGERRQGRVAIAADRLLAVRPHGRCHLRHLLEGDNLYISPGGQRHCRACARLR